MKKWLKKVTCKHYRATLVRWHWSHGPNGNEPRTVEAEYKCDACGKDVYLHLSRAESEEWSKIMGHHKQDGFQTTTV